MLYLMTNIEDTDIILMQRIKSGDIQSFDKLLERHHKRVLNIVYKYIGNKQSAEDLVQEVFLRIYKSRHSYKPKAKFTTWLYEIVKNLCLQELKKKSNKTYSIEANQENPKMNHIANLQNPGALPPEIIEKEEITLLIKEVIDSLPPNQRMAVVLNKYEDLSYQEIADSMAISMKAVKSLLSRARMNIKEKLLTYVDLNK